MYNAVVPGMPIWPITQERGIQGEKTKPFRERKGFTGVANAARTRDLLNHNQMLYQLSYSHHVLTSMRKRNEWILYTIFWMCARRRVALPAVK